MTGED